MNKLFVVSDGSGRTAEQILMAALTQFPDSRVEIVLRPEVRTEQAVEEIVSVVFP